MISRNIKIISIFLVSLVFLQLHGQEKYAVVVGVSNYENLAVSDLTHADDDAFLFKEVLMSKAMNLSAVNIDLLLNQNATYSNFIQSMAEKVGYLKEGDKLYIFFSGHGELNKSNKEGFLCTYDYNPNELLTTPLTGYLKGRLNALSLLKINNMKSIAFITCAVLIVSCKTYLPPGQLYIDKFVEQEELILHKTVSHSYFLNKSDDQLAVDTVYLNITPVDQDTITLGKYKVWVLGVDQQKDGLGYSYKFIDTGTVYLGPSIKDTVYNFRLIK